MAATGDDKRIPEVVVDEISPPHVPGLLAVLVDLAHAVEAAVGFESHVLGQRVEQLGNHLVAPEGILDDAPVMEQRDIPPLVDDVVRKEDVGCDLVPGLAVESLEGHDVEVHELGGVVHLDHREPQDPAGKGDVLAAGDLALLEPDPRPRRAWWPTGLCHRRPHAPCHASSLWRTFLGFFSWDSRLFLKTSRTWRHLPIVMTRVSGEQNLRMSLLMNLSSRVVGAKSVH